MTSLRQRMIEDMQIRNLAVHTQNTYVLQVSMFARHFGNSPEFDSHRDFCASLPLQNYSPQGLDLRRDHPRSQKASETAGCA